MEEIIHAFGIDGRLIVIQIVNFGILIAILSYFLYTPVLKLLADREEKIRKGIEDADRATNALRDADDTRKVILSEAHVDAEQIATRAKQYADEKSFELLKDANAKAELVIANAQARGDELKAQIHKESEREIAKLAILAAEKVLKEKST